MTIRAQAWTPPPPHGSASECGTGSARVGVDRGTPASAPAALLAGAMGAACLLLAGCQSPAHDLEPGDPWPFRPTSMRIHPLTRFVEADEFGPVIELHMEFSDADGHDSRAVGEVVVRLTARGGIESEPLEWRVDLDDLATNARLFRAVTRTYEVPLSVRWETPPAGTTVAIEATHDDGAGALHRSSIVLERR